MVMTWGFSSTPFGFGTGPFGGANYGVQVLLDDATNSGAFPFDITSYVRLVDGINITRGRGDEFSTVQPSALTMTLENMDGRFTFGSTVGGYGTINVDRRIRVNVTTTTGTTPRFTGYVNTWPVAWPDGSDQFATAQISATDRSAAMSRHTLKSVIAEEYLLDKPSIYLPLGEPDGSLSAGDQSGNGRASFPLAGSGAPVVFGSATGPGTDSLTATQFAGGKYLARPRVNGVEWGECFFSSTTTPGVGGAFLLRAIEIGGPLDGNWVGLGINSSGQLWAHIDAWGATSTADLTSSVSVTDGATHHAALDVTAPVGRGTWQWDLYLDGALVGSTTTSSPRVGTSNAVSEIGRNFTGVIAHVATAKSAQTPLGATRIAAHAAAGLNGFTSDSSAARIARYGTYNGLTAADEALETPVLTAVPHLDITDMSTWAAMEKIAEAEGGIVFIRGDGKLVMHNRNHRTLGQGTPTLTLTAADLAEDVQVTADMQFVSNYVTASTANGATQVASNAASIAVHDVYPKDLSGLLVPTDAAALDAASWLANAYAEPLPRFGSITVDLLTQTPALQASAQAVELGDHLRLTGLPGQAPNSGQVDLIAEGWTESLTAESWSMTFNASSYAQAAAWILGDPANGVLDSTTRLFY